MQDLKELNEVITAIKEEIRQGADALTTSKSVYEFKKTFLDNKQGRIGLLMKEMRNVANDQKAEFGKTINGAKEWANNFFWPAPTAARKSVCPRCLRPWVLTRPV